MLEDWIPIESNEEYIVLKVGQLLFIYDRRLKGQLRGTVKNAALFEFLFSDDLLVFNENLIDHRVVERPVLQIQESYGAVPGEWTIYLKAVSIVFGETKTCFISINSTVMQDANFKGI